MPACWKHIIIPKTNYIKYPEGALHGMCEPLLNTQDGTSPEKQRGRSSLVQLLSCIQTRICWDPALPNPFLFSFLLEHHPFIYLLVKPDSFFSCNFWDWFLPFVLIHCFSMYLPSVYLLVLICYGLNCVLQNSCYTPNPQHDHVWRQGFGEVIKVKWGYKSGS